MSNKTANYQLTRQDYIEAQQLYEHNEKDLWVNIGIIILLLSQIIMYLIRLRHPDFLMMEKYKNYYTYEQNLEYLYILIWTCSIGFSAFFGRTFPKLNPLAYWNTKKDLQKNFVKQEAKQISITKEGIAIASQNYREYHQWQGITKTAKNKKIFLLYHSRNQECTIVPKRIFATEAELTNFSDSSKQQGKLNIALFFIMN